MSAQTAKFLKKASQMYKDICPEQSRFLMKIQQSTKGEKEPEAVLCPFCFQWRTPDNHQVRIKPKRKASVQIHRILRKEAARKRLSPIELKILRRFRNSCSTRMTTCNTCKKTSKSRGVSRDTMAALSTPGKAGKQKTPGRTPRSTNGGITPKSTEKTPNGRPRSVLSESTSTPSLKQGETKKSAFARLRKLLMLSESPTSKKGGLKAFLSSL
ncbi:hypothetical protein JZ751_000273 [Albula glossodonta]|uniref:Uncharacterized protein n=1 Tax=Albula glossodonta TaxID=121402 RepID=A0A8T2PVS5_9TELE|nr:hypothetical protein JZ751_000273 [Albula glossodonta]